MTICIIVGARPNFIKVAPLVRAIESAALEGTAVSCQLVYAGVENDATLDATLFSDLQLRRPDVFLGADSPNLNELTGQVMSQFDNYLAAHPCDIVIVVDDLASTMAAAIVTKKRGIRLAHLVAGTRSFDITMPKEINRLVIDGLSDYLFTAGIGSSSVVSREGAELSNVYEVGNILIDTLRTNYPRFERPAVVGDICGGDGPYLVFTLNRRALIADGDKLRQLVKAIEKSAGTTPVIAPLRQEARQAVESIISDGSPIHITDPLPYLQFGHLTAHALGIITDSGNVAEEATFNNVPCVTLNSYTEHIETVKQGTNVLVGEDPEQLSASISSIVGGTWKRSAIPDRWDGRTAERILHIILNLA